MNRRYVRLAASVGAVAALTAACSKSNGSTNANPTQAPAATSSAATVGSETAASGVRAVLTSLLQEHVYLAGIATGTAIQKGGNLKDPAVLGAVNALDANSVALATTVDSVYPGTKDVFLKSWRAHIDMFVNYALGKATGNKAMADKAVKDLDGYRTTFGALLHGVIKTLPADAVAQELIPHIQTLAAAVDAQVAKSPEQFGLLQKAADHMSMTADILAGGIAKDKGLAGDADGTGAGARAALTSLLQEHVYLAGLSTGTAISKGGNLKDPTVLGAVNALDANSVAIATTVDSVYPGTKDVFLKSWRAHIDMFVNYALGKATGNKAMADKAVKDLDGYRTTFGALLHGVIKTLPADAVAQELIPHIQTLAAAVDAQVAKSPEQFGLLQKAADHMSMTAEILAKGISADKGLTS